jgi:Tol biopolymer transport system component
LSDNGASGIPITDAGAFNPFFSPDGNYIVYSNTNDGYRLYKKNISET